MVRCNKDHIRTDGGEFRPCRKPMRKEPAPQGLLLRAFVIILPACGVHCLIDDSLREGIKGAVDVPTACSLFPSLANQKKRKKVCASQNAAYSKEKFPNQQASKGFTKGLSTL
eukprot:40462-Pelagomonas_calceolata.AAC.1